MNFTIFKKIPVLIAMIATMFLWQNCSDFEALDSLDGNSFFRSSSVVDVEARNTLINACNAASMAQVPGTSIFLGRMGVNLGPNGCTRNERYTSAVYHRTVENNGDIHYTYSHNLLDIDQRIDSSTVLSHSYDPYPFYMNGQLFAVFECAINGRGGSSVNVCVARVDENVYKINPTDIKILVQETHVNGHRLTAAVPKVLSHPQGMFLYWNTVKINRSGKFLEVNARGTEIFLNDNNEFVDRSGATRLAAHGHDVVLSGPVNGSAEIYDITVGSDGQTYALATISESGCTHPAAPYNDCYRLSIVSSSSPLMESQATVNHLAHGIPLHSHEYSRFSWLNGRTTISLQFVKNDSNSENQESLVGQHRSFLLDPNNNFPQKKRTTYIRWLSDLTAPINVPPVVVPVAAPTQPSTPPPSANPVMPVVAPTQPSTPPTSPNPVKPTPPPQATDYANIVRLLYLEVLRRPADSAGLNFYVTLMEQGRTEATVRNDLLRSPEYKEKIEYPAIVRRLYLEVLRREADSGGLAHYVRYMVQGQSESQIRQHLLNSSEYRNLR